MNLKQIITVLKIDKPCLFVLTTLVSIGSIYVTYGRADILNLVLARSNSVWAHIGFLIALLLTTEGIRSLLKIINAKLVRSWKLFLGERISRQIENMAYQRFHSVDAGEHMTAYTYNLEIVSGYLLSPLLSLISACVLFVSALAFLWMMTWKLALFAIVSTLLLFVISGHFSKKIQAGYSQLSVLNGAFSGQLKEYVTGYDVLKNLDRLSLFTKKVAESQTDKENQPF